VVTAAAVGYAMASVLPPMVAMLLSQVLVFGVLLFSPINYPAERLPEWMQSVHSLLPLQAMGEVMRGSLASETFPLMAGSVVTLVVWCGAALAVSYLALQRRA
jgi:ABC-2 type transport system permease protein